MFAAFTVPLSITFLDIVFLLLCNGLYHLITRLRKWARPAPTISRQLLLTLGLQAVLLVLLTVAEPLIQLRYRDPTQVIASIGFSSTAMFPLLLLIRHLWRATQLGG